MDDEQYVDPKFDHPNQWLPIAKRDRGNPVKMEAAREMLRERNRTIRSMKDFGPRRKAPAADAAQVDDETDS